MRLALIALAACGAPPRTSSVEPAVKVLEVGSEPRRVVRYELAAGSRARVELTSKATVTAAITSTVLETSTQKTELPTERRRVTIEVREKRPTGEAKLASVVDHASIDPDGAVDARMRGDLERDVAKQRGGKRAWWMSPAGVVEPIEVKVSEPRLAVTELVRLTVQDHVVRFPDQAIGGGGTWQVVTSPRLEGIAWQRTETFRVIALGEDSVTLDAEIVMKAGSQALSVEPNATTTLKGATFRTTSKLVVPLRGLASEAYGETHGEVSLAILQRDLRVTSSTQIQSVFTAKPREN